MEESGYLPEYINTTTIGARIYHRAPYQTHAKHTLETVTDPRVSLILRWQAAVFIPTCLEAVGCSPRRQYFLYPIKVVQHCPRVGKSLLHEHDDHRYAIPCAHRHAIPCVNRCLALYDVLVQVGTGFHGTLAGNAYCFSKRILDEIRAFKGMEAAEEDDDEPPGDGLATHQAVIPVSSIIQAHCYRLTRRITHPLEYLSDLCRIPYNKQDTTHPGKFS